MSVNNDVYEVIIIIVNNKMFEIFMTNSKVTQIYYYMLRS